MKRFNLCLFLICLGFLLGCGAKNDDFELEGIVIPLKSSGLDQPKYVFGKVIRPLSDSLFRATTLFQVENRHIAISDIGARNVFHLYDPMENRYLGNYGAKGFGPSEVQVAWKFYQPQSQTLGVFDIDQRKLIEYNLDSLLSNSNHPVEIKLPSNLNSNGVVRWGERIFFMDTNSEKNRLFSSNLDGSDLRFYGSIPSVSSLYPQLSQAEVMNQAGLGKLVRYGSVFAIGYYHLPLIQIFDSENDRWISILGPDSPPSAQTFGKQFFYGSVYVSEKFVYCLYFGREDIFENPATSILVFSHQGDFVKRLSLDIGVFEFIVQNDEIVFGLTRNVADLNYALVKFPIFE
jgi:hypothetical protein